MTSTQQHSTPPRCRYDRALGERVTRHHRDDCPDLDACTGCAPCLHPHCSVCGREHLDDAHPNTCPTCVAGVRDDLAETAALCQQLRGQAAYASDDGRPWAAAPIPGAAAMVLVGPSVVADLVRVSRHFADDHRKGDPIPPLAVLAHWEDTWRTWLGHDHRRRAGIAAAVRYLDEQLTMIAQSGMRLDEHGDVVRPPEFPEFSRAIGQLRAQLEHVLHDEQAPDRGVECFECGNRLVRRHRDRRRCPHSTPARVELEARLRARPAAVEWLATLASYGLRPSAAEINAARLPSPAEVAAARLPCDRCDQGGLADPTPGISWECLSCRMVYTPGQYATAVRRDLLEGTSEGSGWSTFPVAADAAADITGRPISVTTIRTWIQRGDDIAVVCEWFPGALFTRQLVFWPDVARRVTETRQRGRRAAS